MAKQGRLPGDYAIDALVLEVDRRKEKTGDPYYSYGKLVADTTREEREAIAEQYRCGTHRRRRGGLDENCFPGDAGGSGGGGPAANGRRSDRGVIPGLKPGGEGRKKGAPVPV